jgi:excisionase family DNA binding protein
VFAGALENHVDSDRISFSVPEAAQLVGLTPPVLYKAIKEGHLRFWRPWSRGDMRVSREHLEEWFNRERKDAGADHAA